MNRYSLLSASVRNNFRRGCDHRILFLDFDGVINVPFAPGTAEFEMAMQGLTNDFFRPEMAERINRLCRDYGLAVVITSSWRYSGMDYCLDHLYRAGFNPCITVEGMTDTDDPLFRREGEIYRYIIKAKDVSAFLILDDLPLGCYKGHAVQTDFETGYDESCDKEARRLLDGMVRPSQSFVHRAWDHLLETAGQIFLAGKEEL